MSSQAKPSLRVVKVSHDLLGEPGERAQSASSSARRSSAPAEASALAQPAEQASGEIRNNWVLDSSGQTLLGVPGFPAAPRRSFDPGHMYVTPATIAAIAKAKRKTEPNIEVDETLLLTKVKQRPDVVKAKAAPHKWETFEDLGLAPKPVTKAAQKLVVSTYRLIGFGILTVIVAVLLGYIGTTAFYFFDHSWVTPVALSANDEKVVALQSELNRQLNERAKLESDLAQSERAIRAEQTFQLQFAQAIRKDLEGRTAALRRVQQLAHEAASTRDEIRNTNGDYSASTAARMENEYKARLIDRDSMLASKFQLAQISGANLSLAERQAEFDQRAAELSAQTESLDAILADKSHNAALSYDALKIARDYQTSKLELARETGERERLKASIERQDKIIAGLNGAGYMRAVAEHATVALVPYANLENVKKGTPLFSCKLSMFWCHEVGKVLDVLPGEVLVKHPHRDDMLRGRMIEMQMTDGEAAQDEVLFAGRAPLGL